MVAYIVSFESPVYVSGYFNLRHMFVLVYIWEAFKGLFGNPSSKLYYNSKSFIILHF